MDGKRLRSLRRAGAGQGLGEYALIVAIIVVLVIAAIQYLTSTGHGV